MREGWEIRKLGDLTTALNGLWVGKKPPFVNIAVIRNTNFTKDCQLDTTDIAYIDAEVKHFSTRKLQCGDIIIEKSGGSDKQPVGRPVLFNIPEGDFSFSNFTSTLRINDQSEILPSFLHKALWAIYRSGKTASLQSKTTGIRNLDFKSYLKLPIPVPPIAEQEKIVAEMDCLTGIIEKKKQQLEELDKLAQSIFYDMFGDPITNEKGWTTSTLKDICEKLYAGGDVPKERLSRTKTGIYSVPILSNGKGDSAIYGYTDIPREISPAITISGRGTIGYSRIQIEPFFPIIRLIVAVPSPHINIVFLHSHISLMPFESTGGAIPQLTVPMVKNRCIICPPLDLQNEFAQKVEAIEKQKELVKLSIVETETLFNSRMDYWFN